jgi:hypothetical protein
MPNYLDIPSVLHIVFSEYGAEINDKQRGYGL